MMKEHLDFWVSISDGQILLGMERDFFGNIFVLVFIEHQSIQFFYLRTVVQVRHTIYGEIDSPYIW